ncbi:MAG: VOC family protein [Gaiellaceae bacterium]
MRDMRPEKLDHVALFVSDPERVAAKLCAHLPFDVIEETDEFVLVGGSPELGKITLFGAQGPRHPGALVRIGIGVPTAIDATWLDVGEGLTFELLPASAKVHAELASIGLLVPNPVASAHAWLEFGFEQAEPAGPIERVQLGGALVEFQEGSPSATERPLLNHLGLLVESIDDVRETVAEQGFHVNREVDAENSMAIFVRGPDDVEIEYIEHKPSFAVA